MTATRFEPTTTWFVNEHSIIKRLKLHLRTKWLWVWIPLLSLKLQIWHLLRARSSLTFRQTIEWGFTLKLVGDMIITCTLMSNATEKPNIQILDLNMPHLPRFEQNKTFPQKLPHYFSLFTKPWNFMQKVRKKVLS